MFDRLSFLNAFVCTRSLRKRYYSHLFPRSHMTPVVEQENEDLPSRRLAPKPLHLFC